MRILIVEDEYMIASVAAEALEQAGCEIVGIAATVAKALNELAESSCDAVLLDVNLGGANSEPVAHELVRRGLPFLVASGYSSGQRRGALAGVPFLAKPYDLDDLVAAMLALRK